MGMVKTGLKTSITAKVVRVSLVVGDASNTKVWLPMNFSVAWKNNASLDFNVLSTQLTSI